MKKDFSFNKKHPILFNLLLIAITFFVICYCALVAADIFTEHGKMQEVPDVKGKNHSRSPGNNRKRRLEMRDIRLGIQQELQSRMRDRAKPQRLVARKVEAHHLPHREPLQPTHCIVPSR